MNNLIKTFDPSILEVDRETGMVNLTRIANHFGKLVADWSKTKSTQSFLNAYASEYPDMNIIISNKGGQAEQGTWAVRHVAIEFAQWINPAFKVFCIKKLDELFQTGKTEISPVKRMTAKEILLMALDAENRAEMAEEQTRLLTETIKKQAPIVEYHEQVMQSRDSWPITLIAAELGMSAIALNRVLQEKNIHRRVSGVWVLNAQFNDKGYTTTRTHTYTDTTGQQRTNQLTVWTERGREFLHRLLNVNLNKSLQTA